VVGEHQRAVASAMSLAFRARLRIDSSDSVAQVIVLFQAQTMPSIRTYRNSPALPATFATGRCPSKSKAIVCESGFNL